jgi:predicted AAA+ superfamily ATPase
MSGIQRLRAEVPRRSIAAVRSRLESSPAVVIGGPRSVGKSTLMAALAAGLARSVLDLDDPATRRAVDSDPVRFLDGPRPMLVDEYARVPEAMDVIQWTPLVQWIRNSSVL